METAPKGPTSCEASEQVVTIEQKSVSSQEKQQNVESKIENYHSHLKELKILGHSLRSDNDQPSFSTKPEWYDESLFENASSVYERHFMGLNFAHLSGLLLLVRVDSIYRTLSSTGKSDSVSKLFNRYYNTVKHVKTWYEGDIFEENSEAQRSLKIVRGMHNKVSTNLNDIPIKQGGDIETPQVEVVDTAELMDPNQDVPSTSKAVVHLSEYDIMITQFAFVGLIVTKATNVGLIDDFSQRDLESLLHFWRVIGYYLGASDKFNLCSYKLEDVIGLCQAITEIEYKQSIAKNSITSDPGIMSINIVRSVKFIPMLTIYGIMKYLYELLEIDTAEIENKSSRYSRLSYTLIKLVMTNLLAYKPFRSFNNGLTRLSLYLVGKVDGWFERRLESKYGSELKV